VASRPAICLECHIANQKSVVEGVVHLAHAARPDQESYWPTPALLHRQRFREPDLIVAGCRD
jgi:hypothetical protein